MVLLYVIGLAAAHIFSLCVGLPALEEGHYYLGLGCIAIHFATTLLMVGSSFGGG